MTAARPCPTPSPRLRTRAWARPVWAGIALLLAGSPVAAVVQGTSWWGTPRRRGARRRRRPARCAAPDLTCADRRRAARGPRRARHGPVHGLRRAARATRPGGRERARCARRGRRDPDPHRSGPGAGDSGDAAARHPRLRGDGRRGPRRHGRRRRTRRGGRADAGGVRRPHRTRRRPAPQLDARRGRRRFRAAALRPARAAGRAPPVAAGRRRCGDRGGGDRPLRWRRGSWPRASVAGRFPSSGGAGAGRAPRSGSARSPHCVGSCRRPPRPSCSA